MIELFHVAARLEDSCRQQNWRFCFIGGVSLQRWGQPRVTRDVDLTILTGFGGEETSLAQVQLALPENAESVQSQPF